MEIKLPLQAKDIKGSKYYRLLVMRFVGHKPIGGVNKLAWECLCECGNKIICIGDAIKSGNTKSCGCLKSETTINRCTKHGLTRRGKKAPEHNIWNHMKRRCLNPTNKAYKDYGGRGIKICEKWLNFENFYRDMGPRPSSKHSIERVNNDGNYEPDNCLWILKSDQNKNQRSNLIINYQGETKILSEWAKSLNLKYMFLYHRLIRKKQSMEQVLGLKKSP